MKKHGEYLIALVGQPNCGKSTVFNVLTGAHQRVANWPGVTVDKVSGWYKKNDRKAEIVDLPGMYSLASFSPEERVSRDFLLHEKPSLVINVIDASALKQGLNLTLQLREMGIPLIVDLNMMDVAHKRRLAINTAELENLLGVPVVPTSMKKGKGRQALLSAISARLDKPSTDKPLPIDYLYMEPFLNDIEKRLSINGAVQGGCPLRWMAVKLMEGGYNEKGVVRDNHGEAGGDIIKFAQQSRRAFEKQYGEAAEVFITRCRQSAAGIIVKFCIQRSAPPGHPLSDRIDRIVCNRLAGPVILVAVMYLLYYLSIIQGYKLTSYTWPLLAKLRNLVEAATPVPGFIEIPLIRSFFLWFTDSINALLNYVPIFFILFALIAVLEDSGYMPRMAFIMDRILHRFGLHGQSILPMVLGGIYVGGCAVPAVMSCKGIPDERSRMATILTIPMLNCLAKVPLYVLLVNAYFPEHKGFAMFFISTVSLLLVLPVAKVLTLTVLKNRETAPFVMEMPAYHVPAIRSVLNKAMERLWLFLRKITTIVAAVAVIIFVLLQFPGLNAERMKHYEDEKERLIGLFSKTIAGTSYSPSVQNSGLMPLILYCDAYKGARMTARGETATASVKRRFRERNPVLYRIVQPDGEPEATRANRALKGLVLGRDRLLADMRRERLESSLLGRLGKGLESLTMWAGFDWRVNVALLSALAAKESSVATLGAIYEQDEGRGSLETRIAAKETGITPLNALALMLFMVLYPPCIATAIAVKVQTGSVKWMLFSIGYPVFLGLASAVLVFSAGSTLGISGIKAMCAFYGLALSLALVTGFIKPETGGSRVVSLSGRAVQAE